MLIRIFVFIVFFHLVQSKSRGLQFITSKIIQDSLVLKKNEFPEYVHLKIELINPGTENSYFNIEADIFKDLPSEIEIQLSVDKLNRKGQYEPTPLAIKKNYCAYMAMDKVIYPLLLKKGNFPSKCPVKPGKYVVRHFTVTPKDLPISAPIGSYRVMFAYHLNGRMIQTVWKGRAIPA